MEASLTNITQCLGKTCVVGLTYFDLKETIVDQKMLGGEIIKVDEENGLTLRLHGQGDNAEFIFPANLSCWFIAPKGDFHTHNAQIKLTNPDYLVTWDIYQTQDDKSEGEQQWWEWVPRTSPPNVTGS